MGEDDWGGDEVVGWVLGEMAVAFVVRVSSAARTSLAGEGASPVAAASVVVREARSSVTRSRVTSRGSVSSRVSLIVSSGLVGSLGSLSSRSSSEGSDGVGDDVAGASASSVAVSAVVVASVAVDSAATVSSFACLRMSETDHSSSTKRTLA